MSVELNPPHLLKFTVFVCKFVSKLFLISIFDLILLDFSHTLN